MTKTDYIILVGGLGKSQFYPSNGDELAQALEAAGFRVVHAPEMDGCLHLRETIENLENVGRLALIGHSMGVLPCIHVGKEYGADYVCGLDPANSGSFYTLQEGERLDDWFVAKDSWGIPQTEIRGRDFARFVWNSHNEICHNEWVIKHVVKSLTFGG